MPWVLVIQEDDRERRVPLDLGEVVLGSGPDAAVRLGHPTVSRRHARLAVDEEVVRLEDLGSSNGTRLEGVGVEGTVVWRSGARAAFGTLEVRLETVGAEEMTAAVLLETAPAPPEAAGLHRPTMSVGSLRAFALTALPEIVEAVETCGSADAVARRAGAVLLEVLPAARVEIRDVHESDGLVFAGGEDDPPGPTVVERVAGDLRFRVLFDDAVRADGFEPLVDLGVRIAALAGRGEPRRTRLPEPRRRAVRAPDPPSVVPSVQKVYAEAVRVAPSDVGVVVVGESGTGKEVLARFLHRASDRSSGPFVALNCAALPEDLLEAELFGVERGVATGVDARPGKFELADEGTLFLDEIGDMAPATQSRILRVLQEREVHRLGGRGARPARVRVIAATNRDLEALVREGSFRLDLYHRIADWTVELPPLRRRSRDIPNLAAHFLGAAAGKRGVRVRGISTAAMEVLREFDWPGNIRQLEREMQRAVLFLEDGELLQTRHLQSTIRQGPEQPPVDETLKGRLELHERRILQEAISAADGNLTAAAKALGIGRSTLYRRLGDLGLPS